MEAQPLEPGTFIDRRYTIRRFIASGGIAYVYAATHRITGREVALKLPRPDRDRDAMVHERLVREGHALAKARHPGVVELIDAGEHEGAPYLALELLEGRTLGGLLAARSKLGWEEVAYVGLKVADIVGHCHASGVVHRDIKPDNLFALPSGQWNVKLFDFGIALLVGEAERNPVSKLTQEGSILGTPEYMAPEALEMKSGQDHRVDIYSLGVMLFELLTGGVPFEGRYADVLVQVSTKQIPPIPVLRPDAPPALGALVMRCLAKEPGARFATMAEVSRQLRAVLGRIDSIPLAVPTPADAPSGGKVPSADGDKLTLADSPVALQSAQPKPAPPVGKRRFPRAPYTTPVEVKLASGESISGRVEEISEGGLQFIAARGVKLGDRAEFRFAEPITGKVLKLTGISRWTKEARAARHATGFEFENAPDETRQTIRKYVELMGGN